MVESAHQFPLNITSVPIRSGANMDGFSMPLRMRRANFKFAHIPECYFDVEYL